MPIQPKQQPPYYTPAAMPTPGGETNKYAIYVLNQYGTDNPESTLIYNSLGEPLSLSIRTGMGRYFLEFVNNCMPEARTSIFTGTLRQQEDAYVYTIRAYAGDEKTVYIDTDLFYFDTDTLQKAPYDGILYNTYIMIIVTP